MMTTGSRFIIMLAALAIISKVWGPRVAILAFIVGTLINLLDNWSGVTQ